MQQHRTLWPLGCALAAAPAGQVWAGMPTPLPIDVPRFLRVNDTAYERLQAISFFLMAFLACAAVVMLLWNYVRRDFPVLPWLSFGRATAGLVLWGLLFVIVLTMISGARELMTPGAWEPDGVVYKLRKSDDIVRPAPTTKDADWDTGLAPIPRPAKGGLGEEAP
jgi:hypothetical protein